MSEWISVKDRTPTVGTPVIVCRPYAKGERRVEQGFKDIGDWWRVYGTRVKTVTHWMPFPEPPEDSASTCTATGQPCAGCQPGPCGSRREANHGSN